MAYTDRFAVEEFPYKGTFYTEEIDMDLPPSQQGTVRVDILTDIDCDIQEAHSLNSGGFTSASYKIFFKYDSMVDFPIRRGMLFEGSISGMPVRGEVFGIYPSKRFSKCGVYIKDVNS